MGRRLDEDREAFWRDVVERQAESGLTVAAFCRQEQISPPSFFAWRKKLTCREKPRFVPVTISAPASAANFEIRLKGGAVVTVPSEFDEASLRRLLQVVCAVERGDA
ncbi:IS66 family insertion sequence element accessory protein TnpA [Lignipirellula cremea]|uniref:Transposase n=1 Tax=Lignipirellula cremea TaxID=2528010 RepID=A0A518DKA3_9BACT|nr:transposase [Lignipirellula cremea]QDU92266.1 hypothetical protein Pla8534_00110 [Lignipirellula cremea]